MKREGPSLADLMHQLGECPAEFRREPIDGEGSGEAHVAAIVSDLLLNRSLPPLTKEEAQAFAPFNSDVKPNHQRLILIACWLLDSPWFKEQKELLPDIPTFLNEFCVDLAEILRAETCLDDVERREEFIRLVLQHLDLRPQGESEEEARDFLTSLDSAERLRVIAAARKAEARARQIREEMALKKAQEAAASYGRE